MAAESQRCSCKAQAAPPDVRTPRHCQCTRLPATLNLRETTGEGWSTRSPLRVRQTSRHQTLFVGTPGGQRLRHKGERDGSRGPRGHDQHGRQGEGFTSADPVAFREAVREPRRRVVPGVLTPGGTPVLGGARALARRALTRSQSCVGTDGNLLRALPRLVCRDWLLPRPPLLARPCHPPRLQSQQQSRPVLEALTCRALRMRDVPESSQPPCGVDTPTGGQFPTRMRRPGVAAGGDGVEGAQSAAVCVRSGVSWPGLKRPW